MELRRYDCGIEITQAQKDVRETFLGGFAGQLVSACLWAVSGTASTWYSLHMGELILVLGGFFIFPLTQLVLRSMGHAYALPKGHPMNPLGVQVAFTLAFTLPLVLAIATFHPPWFYPALMIPLGAHYLSFIFVYGMWQYGVLAAALIVSGSIIGKYIPPHSAWAHGSPQLSSGCLHLSRAALLAQLSLSCRCRCPAAKSPPPPGSHTRNSRG